MATKTCSLEKMKKKIIGLVGYQKKEILNFKKKFKKFNFLNINDQNFYKNESTNIDALIVLVEYPVKKSLSKFLSEKFKLFKKLKWFHLSRAGVDECIPFMKN